MQDLQSFKNNEPLFQKISEVFFPMQKELAHIAIEIWLAGNKFILLCIDFFHSRGTVFLYSCLMHTIQKFYSSPMGVIVISQFGFYQYKELCNQFLIHGSKAKTTVLEQRTLLPFTQKVCLTCLTAIFLLSTFVATAFTSP